MKLGILGEMRVFKNEFNGRTSYCTTVSSKKQDGTYDKMYVPVQFAQCEATDGDIDITKGFHGMYVDKNGLGKIKFVVQAYNKVEDYPPESPVMAGDFENDLPF